MADAVAYERVKPEAVLRAVRSLPEGRVVEDSYGMLARSGGAEVWCFCGLGALTIEHAKRFEDPSPIVHRDDIVGRLGLPTDYITGFDTGFENGSLETDWDGDADLKAGFEDGLASRKLLEREHIEVSTVMDVAEELHAQMADPE